jgi:hypothetical protein
VVPTLDGNQLFPLDNPWNQNVSHAPVAANSDTLIGSIGATKSVHADFGASLWDGSLIGIPYNVVPGNQPKVNVVIDAYSDESDLLPAPIPSNAVIEGDPLPGSQNTSDRHLLVYDKDHNVLYEFYNAHRPSEMPDGQWHADAEAFWDLKVNYFRPPGWTSADAAGLPILPGLVRPDEVYDQGVIKHAIRFTVPKSMSAYVFPASHDAGSNNPSYPRMGERFRLRSDFDLSGFSAANRVILQAMKDYGLIVADNGSGWYISGEPSTRWDDNDLQKLGQVKGSDFEALDLTPEVAGVIPSGGPTAGGTAVLITGLNFSGSAGLSQITFGGTPAPAFTINADNSITAVAPPHAAGTVDVRVLSPYGASALSSADWYTYKNPTKPGLLSFALGLDGQAYGLPVGPGGTPDGGYYLAGQGQVKALRPAVSVAGTWQTFAIGLDDQIYTEKFDAYGNPTTGYVLTRPGMVKALEVGRDAGGNFELFVVGLDDQVWAQKFDAAGNSVGGYFLTAVGQVRGLAAGRDAAGRPEVFVMGLDSRVWALKLDAAGNPAGGYFLAAAGYVKSFEVGRTAAGAPEVFAIGLDDQVWALNFDANGDPLGGYFLTAVGQVKSLRAANDAGGAPELFVTGLDDQVWALHLDGSGRTAGGYALTSPGKVKAFSIGQLPNGCPELFAIGLDDQVYLQTFAADGGSTSGYFLSAPGVVLGLEVPV